MVRMWMKAVASEPESVTRHLSWQIVANHEKSVIFGYNLGPLYYEAEVLSIRKRCCIISIIIL
jgi:hypothetical protein